MEECTIMDIITRERINGKLDQLLNEDKDYKKICLKYEKYCELLDEENLSKHQQKIVYRLLDTANESSARYGKLAYKLGFQDGFQMIQEFRQAE